MELIDKAAVVAEIERIKKAIPRDETDIRLKVVYGNEAFVLMNLLSFVNDLEVKEVIFALDNGKMPIERWREAVKAASNQANYRKCQGLTETCDDYFVDGVQWADEHPIETKNVDLEEEIEKYLDHNYYIDEEGIVCDRSHPRLEYCEDKFKKDARHFANWQKEQFEKNRLAACERQTGEEAEREQDFVMSIIENEHRQPTFSDAIEYGIRWQKQQMMKDAVSAVVTENYGFAKIDGEWKRVGQNQVMVFPNNVAEGDKVKVIIIKEE